VIFQSNVAKKNQKTAIWFKLDKSTSCLSLSFLLFLDHSRNVLHAHKMNEYSGMLQDYSCCKKLTKVNHYKIYTASCNKDLWYIVLPSTKGTLSGKKMEMCHRHLRKIY
jgi:hypothetical protein